MLTVREHVFLLSLLFIREMEENRIFIYLFIHFLVIPQPVCWMHCAVAPWGDCRRRDCCGFPPLSGGFLSPPCVTAESLQEMKSLERSALLDGS